MARIHSTKTLIGVAFHLSYPSRDPGQSLTSEYSAVFPGTGRPGTPFAHNGRFDSIERDYAGSWKRYRPIGETDSEIAFCILLERLAPLWESGSVPALARRLAVFRQFAADMRAIGPANFLYSDGDALFVHGHRRTQADGHVAPPGLWRLSRQCDSCDDAAKPDQATSSTISRGQQEVILFASIPLSDEHWLPVAEGEVLAIRHGRLLYSAGTRVVREAALAQ